MGGMGATTLRMVEDAEENPPKLKGTSFVRWSLDSIGSVFTMCNCGLTSCDRAPPSRIPGANAGGLPLFPVSPGLLMDAERNPLFRENALRSAGGTAPRNRLL